MDAWASTSAKQADIISASHNGQIQQSNQVGIRRKTGCFFRAERGGQHIQQYIWKSERSSKKRQISGTINRHTRVGVNKT